MRVHVFGFFSLERLLVGWCFGSFFFYDLMDLYEPWLINAVDLVEVVKGDAEPSFSGQVPDCSCFEVFGTSAL